MPAVPRRPRFRSRCSALFGKESWRLLRGVEDEVERERNIARRAADFAKLLYADIRKILVLLQPVDQSLRIGHVFSIGRSAFERAFVIVFQREAGNPDRLVIAKRAGDLAKTFKHRRPGFEPAVAIVEFFVETLCRFYI